MCDASIRSVGSWDVAGVKTGQKGPSVFPSSTCTSQEEKGARVGERDDIRVEFSVGHERLMELKQF